MVEDTATMDIIDCEKNFIEVIHIINIRIMWSA